ncbi:MAG: TetR/AcrR family transcriptional regulator [bacterium]|nr:TetR/AcrR family transcriptional regulator [bacterium]MCM1373957.1 TetR/AcrR family transcriptional regulator [Muribaculum sp.]
MTQEKVDRRVRRTKTLLLQGLIQLMEEKDIKDISVKELSDLADINRGTFYLHYNDVYDMLNKIEEELFREFNDILERDLTGANTSSVIPQPVLLDLFVFLGRNRDLSRVLIGPHGDLAFLNRLKDLVKEKLRMMMDNAECSVEHFDYLYSFMVSGCTGVIECWLNQKTPASPEEIAGYCSALLHGGLPAVQ